jgi:hypothetical protein
MIFWLIGWTIGGLFVFGLLLWGYFGEEIIRIENSQVVLSKNVFGIGTNKRLKKSEVKNIRLKDYKLLTA